MFALSACSEWFPADSIIARQPFLWHSEMHTSIAVIVQWWQIEILCSLAEVSSVLLFIISID